MQVEISGRTLELIQKQVARGGLFTGNHEVHEDHKGIELVKSTKEQ